MRAAGFILFVMLAGAALFWAFAGIFGSRSADTGGEESLARSASEPRPLASGEASRKGLGSDGPTVSGVPRGAEPSPAQSVEGGEAQSGLHRPPQKTHRPLRYEHETRNVIEDPARQGPAAGGTVRYWRVVPDSAGSLKTEGIRIVLAGIDALAPDANCEAAGGEKWPCGHIAIFALRRFIRGRAVACDLMDSIADDAALARCRVGGRDINQWLVRQGWAVPGDGAKRLDSALEVAKREQKGQWRQQPPRAE